MDDELVDMTLFYLREIRTRLPTPFDRQSNHLFVTFDGKQVSGTTINDSMKQLGVDGATCTKVRKAVSTTINAVLPTEKESLAGFMKHTAKTADRFYNLSQSGVRAARQANILTKVMLGEKVDESDLKAARSCKCT